MTRVVHLQNHLPSSGNAAFRLHRAMVLGGVDSTMLSLTSDKPADEKIAHLGMKASIKSVINGRFHMRQTRNVIQEYGIFSYPTLGNNISTHEFIRKADIIYIHWAVGGFMTLKNMEQLAKLNKPIIIFMHDMWHITGGCHYSFNCENYIENCNGCQMFPEPKPKLPVKGFDKKHKFYHKYENLYFVSPSSWLSQLAKKSGLTRDKPVYHIPNVIDFSLFKPFGKKAARHILNLSENDTIISFGAVSPRSPYKGWLYLKESLEILAKNQKMENILVAIFGSDHDTEIADAIPFRTIFLGRFKDDYSTAIVYNAADIFMAPSLADNLPTTVMESLCCGTAVVGFDNGGIPDMVIHKKNGYLATYKDAEDLARGIEFCLENQLEVVPPTFFDTDVIIDTHKALHEKILSS